MKEKQVISKEVETKFISTIIKFVNDEGLTITNIKEAMEKTYRYMENNATLKRLPNNHR
jgi:hypothetical protein